MPRHGMKGFFLDRGGQREIREFLAIAHWLLSL